MSKQKTKYSFFTTLDTSVLSALMRREDSSRPLELT
jgi:hypothetical protein